MKNGRQRYGGTGKVWSWIAGAFILGIAMPGSGIAFTVSGVSDTIFRTTRTPDGGDAFPLYEYLRLSVPSAGPEGGITFAIGGWGRVDLGGRTTDRHADGDLQYGYVGYRAPRNNTVVNAGRQYVAEGVGSERIDGLYVRSDIAYGIGIGAYGGSPVVTEPGSPAGDVLYGARVSLALPNDSVIGLSALRSTLGGERYREEEGVDVWIHPVKHVEIVGRSAYNSITSGWMEHGYGVSYSPLKNLQVRGTLSQVNYRNYFFHTTTPILGTAAFGAIDPNERVLSVGGSLNFSPSKTISLGADFTTYDYRIRDNGTNFGLKATVSVSDATSAGFSFHRMDGGTALLRYDEFRIFAANRMGRGAIAADVVQTSYGTAIDGKSVAYSVTAAGSYALADHLSLAADFNYMKSLGAENEIRGLLKLTYAFSAKIGEEGRGSK